MVTHWSHFRQWLKHTFKINYHDWVVVPNIFYYFYCHPYLGKIPNLTIIFFKWVGLTTTPTSLLPWQSLNPIPWLLENYTLNSRLAGSWPGATCLVLETLHLHGMGQVHEISRGKSLRSGEKKRHTKTCTWNAKCPIFLGNFTPKTSNYCLKNRALGFPGTNNVYIYIYIHVGYINITVGGWLGFPNSWVKHKWQEQFCPKSFLSL